MKTQVCSVCKKEKALSEEFFSKHKHTKSGYETTCRECKKIKSREWHTTHKMHDLTYQRNRVSKNKLKIKAAHSLYLHKTKDVLVTISLDDTILLFNSTTHCPICGCELKLTSNKVCDNLSTLDRKNNDMTMTKENTWVICHKCNTTKRNRSFDEFVEYCRMIYLKHGGNLNEEY